MKMKTAVTIAGSDSGGGAGIQADIKTMMANGVYAMSAITALTAQNTTKVADIMEVTPQFLAEQLDCIFTDIRPDAVKTGMVASADLIRTIAGKLTEYQAENIVVDPVMVSTSGARLISEEAIETLKEKLFPLATVITPNIPEAEVLADMEIETVQDMEKAAEVIGTRYGCSVLLKGGHQKNDASDLLWQKDKKPVWFHGVRIDNPNTHGTGCTLSSAIASNLAKGRDLETSVEAAKRYISGALAAMLDLGSGSGPMNHGFAIKEEWYMDNAKKKNNKMNNHSYNEKYNSRSRIEKLTLTALFTAIAVVGSMFSFPIFGSKCAPVQHLVNVLCAVTVGPWWGLGQAFLAALIRNLTGLGSPLAFPGSMCGALLGGLLYRYGKKLPFAYIGEVFGTGIIGGMLSYPVASLIMGNQSAALFTFVVPFLVSTCGGTILAAVIIVSMAKMGVLAKLQNGEV